MTKRPSRRAQKRARLLLMLGGSAAVAGLAWFALRRAPDPEPRARAPAGSGSGAPAVTAPGPAPPPSPPSELRFVEVATSSGLEFRHVSGHSGRFWIPEIMGPGVTVFDAEGDGVDEVLFVNGERWAQDVAAAKTAEAAEAAEPATSRLFRRVDGGYTDVTAERGLGVQAQAFSALAWDPDGDGDQDVVFATLTGTRAFVNDGAGRFREQTAALGLGVGGWTSVLAPLDVDDDGDLDLFVGRYVEWSPAIEAELDCKPDGVRRDYCSPNLFAPTTPALLLNDGAGRFTDGSVAAGLPANATKALGVLTVDLDDDGRLDLIVANDQVRTQVFMVPGDGTLVEQATRLGLVGTEGGAAYAGMGIDGTWSAAPEEGFCVGIGNFFGEPVTLHCRKDSSQPFLSRSGRLGLRGPTLPWVTFGLKWFDADLDGDDDLALANGNVSDEERVAGIPFRQPFQLFESVDGRLRDATAEALGELAGRRMLGRGLAAFDLEGDGDLDLLVGDNNATALVLENRSPRAGASLRLRLHGAPPNTGAIGARIVVEAGARRLQSWVHLTSSYYGLSTSTKVFGLGEHEGTVDVEIRWPSGRVQRVGGLTGDGPVHEITEDTTLAPQERGPGLELASSPRAQAIAAASAGRHAQAVTLLREAIAAEGEDPVLHRELAASLWAEGKQGDARAAASDAAARCLDSDCVLRHVANVLDERGLKELAGVAVEQALTRVEQPSSGLLNYAGVLRERAGQHATAEQAYRAALARLPSNVHAAGNLASLQLTRGDAKGAFATIEPLLQEQPDSPPLLRAAGSIYYTLGQLPEARETFERLLALEPDDGLARYNLGLIALDRGDVATALEQLGRASELRPDDFRVWGNLGAARAARGDTAGARVAFERVLALKPGDAIARRALAQLPRE